MNKSLIKMGIIILGIAIVCKLLFVMFKNIKIDEFHKSAVVVLLDSSIQNQKFLPQEIQYLKSLFAVLDPEDDVKILKIEESSYLIYEGSAGDIKGISNAISTYTKNSTKNSAAYGQGIKKAVEHCFSMKKEGYVPSIVVVGTLASSGSIEKQINWETLPKNIRKTKEYLPDLTMMFVYAPPEKLDLVKTKLSPVLGEKKLIVANSENVDKANMRFLKAIGR